MVSRRSEKFSLSAQTIDEVSAICVQMRKAAGLKDRYRQYGQVLLSGYPDYDPIELNIKELDKILRYLGRTSGEDRK